MPTTEGTPTPVTTGAALAAVLAAGIGALAVGLVVILDAADLFGVPALYEPAGGVSGRMTLAAVIWLVAWGALHVRFRNRELDARRVRRLALVLTGIGILLTLPPVWSLL